MKSQFFFENFNGIFLILRQCQTFDLRQNTNERPFFYALSSSKTITGLGQGAKKPSEFKHDPLWGVDQSTSTYPFDFGDDKDFQLKIGTLLIKDQIDEFGEEGWAKAEKAFWANIGKYSEINNSGQMIVPGNTFRMTTAKKQS